MGTSGLSKKWKEDGRGGEGEREGEKKVLAPTLKNSFLPAFSCAAAGDDAPICCCLFFDFPLPYLHDGFTGNRPSVVIKLNYFPEALRPPPLPFFCQDEATKPKQEGEKTRVTPPKEKKGVVTASCAHGRRRMEGPSTVTPGAGEKG